ncbi:MAG: hypothetical protein N2Z62_15655 [Rhodobacteraceae bacterium]|nr:hypothetical protein [Paracoccaceae bacterium]
MRLASLLLILALAACGRPLTPSETAFALRFHGPDIDPARVRLIHSRMDGPTTVIRNRPRATCQERLYPPRRERLTVAPANAAMALFETVHIHHRRWMADYLEGLPEGRLDLDRAMFFAHEMVHIWQWQNRRRTGYHPLRVAFEHVTTPDPYLIDGDSGARFLDHGWEQQASIMEEYLCCRALAPEAARTARLHAMLSEHFDLPPLGEPLAREIVVPWAGVRREGICD